MTIKFSKAQIRSLRSSCVIRFFWQRFSFQVLLNLLFGQYSDVDGHALKSYQIEIVGRGRLK